MFVVILILTLTLLGLNLERHYDCVLRGKSTSAIYMELIVLLVLSETDWIGVI